MNRLVDSFGRAHSYLRISVTDRCNLRCLYCMPAEGIKLRPKDEILSFEEIARIARIFVRLGVRKIRLTGGEPLVRANLHCLVEMLREIPGVDTLAMTTNAVLLRGKTHLLKCAGLNALNISLDTLRPERFREITLREGWHDVIAAIDESIAQRFESLKINVVVMSGRNDDELLDFLHYFEGKPVNVRFIEYMPFKDNQWQPEKVVSYRQMREAVAREYSLSPLPGDAGDVAKDFAIAGARATVSFITSMTDSFCGNCNRLRLTADGSVKSCLFYAPETGLREALRRGACDEELAGMILLAVEKKPEAHPPMDELAAQENRPMVEIGG